MVAEYSALSILPTDASVNPNVHGGCLGTIWEIDDNVSYTYSSEFLLIRRSKGMRPRCAKFDEGLSMGIHVVCPTQIEQVPCSRCPHFYR